MGVGLLLVATAGDYGLTDDEPTYLRSAERIEAWAREGLLEPAAAFADENLRTAWVFGAANNRNLPVPVGLAVVGRTLGDAWLAPLLALRLGHCLLGGLTAGWLFAALGRRYGRAVALVGLASLVLVPRNFADLHLAATDAPTACLWALTVCAWSRVGERRHSAWIAGVLAGAGLACKATFWLLLPVLVGWALLKRPRARLGSIATLLATSAAVGLALCPMWWHAPFTRALEFWQTSFLETQTNWVNDSYYLGQRYEGPLPWHNALVLPLVTTPIWILALAGCGIVAAWRRRDHEMALWVAGAALLPALRLLPGAPGHDGVRLMLPSLFCLGPLAANGYAALVARRAPRMRSLGSVAIVVLSAWPVVALHPFQLCYYSEIVGGLPGAARLGFETSYWFEAYTPQALRAVQAHLPKGARVATYPAYQGLGVYRQWGLWRSDLDSQPPETADYLLLYGRRASLVLQPQARQVLERETPLWIEQVQGVPLLGLYRAASGPRQHEPLRRWRHGPQGLTDE